MRFYQKTWFIILTLIFFFPLGLFLMWRYSTWGKVPKVIITAILAWVLYVGATAPPPPKQTAADTKPAVKTEQKAPEQKKEPVVKAVPDKVPEVKPKEEKKAEEKKPEVKKEEEKKPEPPAPAKVEQKLSVFDAAIKDVEEEFKNKEFHPYTIDTHFSVDEKEKVVTMNAVMNDGLKKWVALDFADSMIRRFSVAVASRDNRWKQPGNDNYGTLFDEYSIHIGVAPRSQVDNPDKWYYEQWIMPRMHLRQGPNWKEAKRKNE